MINAVLDTSNFENKLKIFSSGLGNIFKELLNNVGGKMTAEAKTNAPRNKGRLQSSINFLFYDDNKGALTTKKKINKSNVWYSNIREHGANITAKKSDYLTFKINGEWKKVKSVKTKAQPFAKPVWNDYFGSESSKGYQELANALIAKMERELQ